MSTDETSTGPKLDTAADCVVRMDSNDQAISSLQWTYPPNMPPMLSVTSWMGHISVYSVQKDGNNAISANQIVQINAPKTTLCVPKQAPAAQQGFGAPMGNPTEKFTPNSAACPVLCSTLTANGDLFAAGCSGCVYHYDLKTLGSAASFDENYRIVARHGKPISAVGMLPDSPLLVTASWDKTVRVWDLRQQLPNAGAPLYQDSGNDGSVAKFAFNGPVHDLVFGPPATVTQQNTSFGGQNSGISRVGVALCAKEAALIDFSRMQVTRPSLKPLQSVKNIMTCASIITNEQNQSYGFVAGCKDGRVMVKLFDDEPSTSMYAPPTLQSNTKVTKSFSFAVERKEKPMSARIGQPEAVKPGYYPMNAIDVHPQFPCTIMTAGGDGAVRTWDIAKRRAIQTFDYGYQPICAAKFGGNGGDMLALALGYDWSRGPANFKSGKAGGVVVKALKIEDVQVK